MGLLRKHPDLATSFWRKFNKTDGCWLWMASKRNGYGQFNLRDGKIQYAHIISYQWLVGPIPEGLHLDHLCRTPACVNPAHLEPVTQRENIRRGVGLPAVNANKTACPRGHEYTPDNTYLDAKNIRHCRKCRREVDKRRRPSKSAAIERETRATFKVGSS